MGLPAEKRTTRSVARPRLSVVRHARDSRGAVQRCAGRRVPRGRGGRDAFTAFLTLCIVLTAFGMGRVALSARAFKASLQAGQLQERIKDERLEGDLLEVERSALATPSRIEQVAEATMRMAEAGDVDYLRVDGTFAPDAGADGADGVAVLGSDGEASDATMERVLEALRGLAASEVQSLLVGDVGLASSR